MGHCWIQNALLSWCYQLLCTLTSWACRSQKGHLDVTKYPLWDEWGICRRLSHSLPPVSLIPSVSLSSWPEPSCVPGLKQEGGAKLSIQVLMELCYQFPAAPNWWDDEDKSSALCAFCPKRGREGREEITREECVCVCVTVHLKHCDVAPTLLPIHSTSPTHWFSDPAFLDKVLKLAMIQPQSVPKMITHMCF